MRSRARRAGIATLMFEEAPMSFALTLATVSFLLAVIWGQPLINELKRQAPWQADPH